MNSATTNAEELLREMSDRLGLSYEPQDWGLVNADAGRFEEFVTFFRQEDLNATQKFELAELILASANERLVQGLRVEVESLKSLAREHSQAFSHHVEYWCGLEDEGDYPLTVLLR